MGELLPTTTDKLIFQRFDQFLKMTVLLGKCLSQIFPSYTLDELKIFHVFYYNFTDNSRNCDWIFQNYDGKIFPIIVFEISVKEKFFPSQIFQKL